MSDMENFKEIAEKCFAGELSGTFVLRNGKEINSEGLIRNNSIYHPYTFFDKPFTYTNSGSIYNGITSSHECDIINFIPDKMTQKKIEIDIPEGKVPVMEQSENGVVITWKDQELTYNILYQSIYKDDKAISSVNNTLRNDTSNRFLTKINVLRKLTNIRNYFGKPDPKEVLSVGWCISSNLSVTSAMPAGFGNVVFLKKEHAEQAIKMLGGELKYLFEPW